MLAEFATLLQEIFPSISPFTAEWVLYKLRSYPADEYANRFYEPRLLPDLSQADVLSSVPFIFFDASGKESKYESPALLISNSCDIAHDEYFLLSHGIFLDSYKEFFDSERIEALRSNSIFNMLFLPQVPKLGDLVFDLSLCSSIPSELGKQYLEEGRIERVASLTMAGYYFFLLKLSAHLLRVEDHREVNRTAVL